jgi:hypothetical protein
MEIAVGMEVHVRNVPAQVTERGFRSFMKPHLQRLLIQHTHCQKQRDRTFASITFLNATDGQKFLAHHGQSKRLPNRPPVRLSNAFVILNFQSNPIYFEISNRKPDEYLVRVLQNEKKQKLIKDVAIHTRTESVMKDNTLPVTFECLSFSIGVWSYTTNSSNLLYNPQLRWDVLGSARLGNQTM